MLVTTEEAEKGLKARREKYPEFQVNLDTAEKEWAKELSELRTSGFTVLRGYMPREQALAIGRAFDDFCAQGKQLQQSRNLENISDGMDWKQSNRFTTDDMKKGEEWLRDRTNILQVDQPLLQFPELAKLSLDPALLDLAGTYLGALPLMSYMKIRKSFANNLPLFDTEFFHIDGNSRSMVKGLLYLTDIGPENGPHEFVSGTHRETKEMDVEGRWTHQDMEKMYGPDRIQSITGKAGDLIIEDTTGFHAATRPAYGDRKIAIFNYVLHPEYGYEAANRATVKLGRNVWDGLSDKQKAAAEELTIVPNQ